MLNMPSIWIYNSLWLSFTVCLIPLMICIAYRRVLSFKRRHIERILQGRTFETYKSAHAFQADVDIVEVIESLFGPQYTVRSYILPIIVDSLVSAGALMLFLITVAPHHFGGRMAGIDSLPAAFFYGLAGAFLWGLYDLLRRFQEADLTPVCLCYITLRVFIVGILSCVMPVVFSEKLTPLIAFALGGFPVQTLLSFLKRQAKDKIELSDNEAIAGEPDLHKLQGVTKRTLEQLDRLCINSAEQLANTNPVKLLVQTNIDWELILDLSDQAVLFMYIGGDGLVALRPMGFRCATDLASLYEGITCDRAETTKKATPLLREAALKLNMSVDSLESVAQNLFWCPQVRFIRCLRGEMNRWTQLAEPVQKTQAASA